MGTKFKIIRSIYNAIIVILVVIALILIFNSAGGVLANGSIEAFKYFTVESNIFAGIVALASIFLIIFNKEPAWFVIIKLISTTSVMVTFSVVVAYLAPTMGAFLLYQGPNLFMHVLVPLMAAVEFIFFTKYYPIKLTVKLLTMAPVFTYGLIYLPNVVIHDGYGNSKYDWYMLGSGGIGFGILSFVIILGLSFLIGFLLSLFYNLFNKKHQKN